MTDDPFLAILVRFIDESLDQLLPFNRRPFEPGTGKPRWEMPHCEIRIIRTRTCALQRRPGREGNAQNGKISTAQTPPPVTNLFDKTSTDSAASFMNRSSAEATLWPYSTLSVRPALYLKHVGKTVSSPPANRAERKRRRTKGGSSENPSRVWSSSERNLSTVRPGSVRTSLSIQLRSLSPEFSSGASFCPPRP